VAGLAGAADTLAARFPRLERVAVELEALEALSDGDAARLAAGLAAAAGNGAAPAELDAAFFTDNSARPLHARAPDAAASRLAHLLATGGVGGGGAPWPRALKLSFPRPLDGRTPIWTALSATPVGLTSLVLRGVPACGLDVLAQRSRALAPSLRHLKLSVDSASLPGRVSGTSAELAASLAAAIAPLTALRSLKLRCDSGYVGVMEIVYLRNDPWRMSAWLPYLSSLSALTLSNGICTPEVPGRLASWLPSLRDLRFECWEGGEGGAASACAACATVTALECQVLHWQLGSLAAAFPCVVEATLCASANVAPPPQPQPPAAWRDLRRLRVLHSYSGSLTGGAPRDLVRQLCGAGAAAALTQLTIGGLVANMDGADIVGLLRAAPELAHLCIQIVSPAVELEAALAGVRHTSLRRLHLQTSGPLLVETEGLLALGAALPNLESLHLGGSEADDVAAALRLQCECRIAGGGGGLYTPWERQALEDEALSSGASPPTFEGRPWGGPLLRAIRRGLERAAGGARYHLRPRPKRASP